MAKKPSYEELEQRVKELEKEAKEGKKAKEETERLKSAIEQSIDGISIGKDGEFTYVNKAYAAMHGYSPEEMVGMNVANAYDPEIPEHPYDLFEQLSTQGFYRGESKRIKKDGTSFTAFQSSTATLFPGSSARWAVTICRDITEQKWTEERIRTLSSAVEQSIDGIGIGNEENGLTYVNKAFAAMHGYSPEEMIGMTAHDFLNKESFLSLKEIGDGLAKYGSHICDMTHIRKDGTAFPAFESFTLLKDDNDEVIGPLSICRDITQIKEAEDMLEESEERYRVLFEDANDAIFIADKETHVILDANKQAERLIDRPRQEIIGMHQSDLHPSFNEEWYEEEYLDQIEKGRDFEEGAEVIGKDGRVIPVFISSKVVSIRGKRVIQSLFRDVAAERKYLDLKEEMLTRKLTDKAKRILMDRYGMNEVEAMNRLRKESRRQSKKLKHIAQAVISSELILD